jgi:GrpB-like predicted nucleotidyltransferase (UPF0157 family)
VSEKVGESFGVCSEPSVLRAQSSMRIVENRPAESLEARIQRVLRDEVRIAPYDPRWRDRFDAERAHLLASLPNDMLGRIEHVGSTAVPGLDAKPIVDMLVEVTDLAATRERIVPVLEAQGYDYFWRATHGETGPPFYAWFIKRDAAGARTHHIHMVERDFEHWDSLLFRDHLIQHPEVAAEYAALKRRLAEAHPHDRIAYTQGKKEFIDRITELARNLSFTIAASSPRDPRGGRN